MAYKNFDKKKYAQEQQAQMADMQNKIKDIGKNFSLSPETLTDYIQFSSRFYKYSPKNTMLIYAQNEYATFTGSYKYFQDQGYSVKKGEHGLKIFVPVTITSFEYEPNKWKRISEATPEEKAKLKKNEYKTRQARAFKIGTVFDISQTNIPPEEYPKFHSVGYDSAQHATIYEGVKNFCENELKCPVEVTDLNSISLNGQYIPALNKIELNTIMKDSKRLPILFHEMGHAIMHSNLEANADKALAQIEFEADSIAVMMKSYYGLQSTEAESHHLSSQYQELSKAENFDFDEVLAGVSNTFATCIDRMSEYVNVSLLKEKLSSIEKRWRDNDGKLIKSLEEIEKETLTEANEYYLDGKKYMIEGEQKPFICTRWQENGENHIRFDAMFDTDKGTNHLYCDTNKMGTFLPDVATNGNAIVCMEEIKTKNATQKYLGKMATQNLDYTKDELVM